MPEAGKEEEWRVESPGETGDTRQETKDERTLRQPKRLSPLIRKDASYLLEDRVAAAFAVVLGGKETPAVVVIEDDMLAFESDDVADAVEVFSMFRNEESTRSKGNDHSRGINIAAFVVYRAGVLSRPDSYIRGIFALGIFQSIGLGNKDRVVGIIEIFPIAVLSGNGKEVVKPGVDRRQHCRVGLVDGKNSRSFWSLGRKSEAIATDLFCLL